MRRYAFRMLDVFTDRLFTGNQLAVVLEAVGLTDAEMQAVAREFNFSETTFVTGSEREGCDFRVRIWTPGRELPMAGHPTVGTALALQREGLVAGRVVFELGVGPVPVEIDTTGSAAMTQPAVEFGPVHPDLGLLAQALSLRPQEVRNDLPAQVVSTGNRFLMVPLTSLDAVRRARPDLDAWDRATEAFGGAAYIWSAQAEAEGVDVHARMFAPTFGIAEDPATGSAAGPFGCYFARHVLGSPDREVHLEIEQGIELGRPSRIAVTVAAGGLRPVVAGKAVFVGEGWLELP